jgi:tetratricopeptide (TPR) repeat protein
MKSFLAIASFCLILLAAGCSQSPQKLLATANKYHDNKKYEEASILYQKVLIKDKTNAEAYYRQGLNLLDQGKIREAVGYLRRAVDLQPSNADAETKLAEIYLTAYAQDPKRNKSLLPDVRDLDTKILQRDPNSFNGLRLAALLALSDKETDKAIATFEKANKVKPYSRELIGWYAETLIQAGKTAEGIALITDMLAHDKSWGQGYDLLFVQYRRSGELEKAEQVLRDRVASDPANATGIQNLANYQLATGRYDQAETTIKKLLGDKKTFPTGALLVGDFYVRAKKNDQALATYEAGEKENPADSVKYKERIVALQAYSNHPDQALQLAKELVDKNPKDQSASDMYAQVLLQTGTRANATKSLDEVKKLVQANPTDALLHFDLSRIYLALNDRDKALTEVQEAITLEQKSPRPRPAVILPAQSVLARIYEDKGDHGKALEQANLVLATQPANAEAILVKDRALIGTNQADKALPDLEALVKQYPNASEARLILANLYLNQRQFDKASAQFDMVTKATPPDPRGYLGLQTVKLASGKAAEAIKGMQDLLDKNPSDPSVRFQLANFQSAAAGMQQANPAAGKQLLESAEDNYKTVLKTNPTSADAWLHLGAVQRQLNQFDAALASFEQAGTADPKNRDAFLNQALLLEAMNKKKEASEAYNKVLNLDPDNPLVLNNLAYMSADSGTNLDQAQTYAERAKKRAPNNADVADTLGYVYFQKNLNAQALQIFRQNVQDHPNIPSFHFHLAMALLKQGDKQGAKEEASKALQSAAAPDLQNKIKSFVNQIG